MNNISNWLNDNFNELTSMRRYLHQNPEVGYDEKNTSQYLKSILRKLGLKIYSNAEMKYGFYTVLGPNSKNTLAIRCDIDALPIHDIKECEYSSNYENTMHACGHDAHMTILIGIIKYLKNNESILKGKIRFLFQPAEECSPGGALSMIAGNAIQDVNDIIGYHLYPKLNSNQIAIKLGYISSTVSVIDFQLYCKGGHTSRPEESVDLVLAASQLICNINTEIKKISSEDNPIVLVFGSINGGETFNVIPSNIQLKGTLRYTNSEMSKIILKKINLAITNITKLYGAQINFDIPYSSPGIYNDESLTQLILNSGNSVLGDENTIILEQASLGGEDFAFYLKKIPGVYFRIGCFDGKATDLHCNFFDIDEKCIKTGIQILNDAILNYKFN